MTMLVLIAGCNVVDVTPDVDPTPTPIAGDEFSADTYAAALRAASLRLRDKLPAPADVAAVRAGKKQAYDVVIARYLEPASNPDLMPRMQAFYEGMFVMGGVTVPDPVNYSEPANLASHLFRSGRPWTEILTAPYCVDDAGVIIACDNGVPASEAAGVITNRAFLKKYGTPAKLNYRRVNALHQIFACGNYPDPDESEPWTRSNVPPSAWPMNQGDPDVAGDEFPDPTLLASDPAGPAPRVSKKYQGLQAGVGACATCHGATMPRRLVFTKFDEDGQYVAARTIADVERPEFNGGKDYCGTVTPGDPTDDIDADSADCHSTVGTYLGAEIADARALATEILRHDRFYECATRRHYDFALGKTQGALGVQAAGGVPPAVVPAEVMSRYRLVYESSGWNTRLLLREVFTGREFLSAQAAEQ